MMVKISVDCHREKMSYIMCFVLRNPTQYGFDHVKVIRSLEHDFFME